MKTYITGWMSGNVTLFVKGSTAAGRKVESRVFPVKHLSKQDTKHAVAEKVVDVNKKAPSAQGGLSELGSAE